MKSFFAGKFYLAVRDENMNIDHLAKTGNSARRYKEQTMMREWINIIETQEMEEGVFDHENEIIKEINTVGADSYDNDMIADEIKAVEQGRSYWELFGRFKSFSVFVYGRNKFQ